MINANDAQKLVEFLKERILDGVEDFLGEQDFETIGSPEYDIVANVAEGDLPDTVELIFSVKLTDTPEEEQEEAPAGNKVEDDEDEQ